jgi:hypothetical protein
MHAYRCHWPREWRLAPMLIKTNLVEKGGKKQNKESPCGEAWRLMLKSGRLVRLRDY